MALGMEACRLWRSSRPSVGLEVVDYDLVLIDASRYVGWIIVCAHNVG